MHKRAVAVFSRGADFGAMARTTALVSMVVLSTASASAETIWERARSPGRSEELRVQTSVERVLLAEGDERDLLRARVGLITLSRGEIEDPRTVVLLLRLRREMGLSPSAHGERLLRQAIKSDLSLSDLAWARLEQAHLLLDRRQLSEAKAALNAGLQAAWRTSVRTESLMLRGLVGLREGTLSAALKDFESVRAFASSRRTMMQAQIGAALVHARLGDRAAMSRSAREAYLVESTRATVSRADPFSSLRLRADEDRAARALLRWGEASMRAAADPELSNRAAASACQLVEEAGGESSRTLAVLSELFRQRCESLPLPSGNDEDDL
jgi:hypothetical protein